MDAKKPSRRSPTKSSAAPSRAGDAAAPARRAPRPRAGVDPARAAASDAPALLARFDRGDFPATLYVEGPSEALKAALLAELRARLGPPRAGRADRAGTARRRERRRRDPRRLPGRLAVRPARADHRARDRGPRAQREERRRAGRGAVPAGGGACLVLVESAADNPRKSLDRLRAACAARWVALPPDRRELLAWGARRLAARGRRRPRRVRSKRRATRAKATRSPSSTSSRSWARWAGTGQRIRRERRRRRCCAPWWAPDLPEYLSAVALGDAGAAAQRLGRLLATGESEGLGAVRAREPGRRGAGRLVALARAARGAAAPHAPRRAERARWTPSTAVKPPGRVAGPTSWQCWSRPRAPSAACAEAAPTPRSGGRRARVAGRRRGARRARAGRSASTRAPGFANLRRP